MVNKLSRGEEIKEGHTKALLIKVVLYLLYWVVRSRLSILLSWFRIQI